MTKCPKCGGSELTSLGITRLALPGGRHEKRRAYWCARCGYVEQRMTRREARRAVRRELSEMLNKR